MSPAFEGVIGIPRTVAETNPRALLDHVHNDDRAEVEQLFDPPHAEPKQFEYRIVRSDGSVGWIQTRVFCVRNDDGAIHHIAGISRDITERKNAVVALAASEARYSELVEKLAAADIAREAVGGRRRESEHDRAPLEARHAQDREPSRGAGTVLVAVDERSVLRLIKRVLQRSDHRVRTVQNGDAALEVASECDTIDLLITDVVLPGMNGRDLAAELRVNHPQLKVLYISGHIGRASVSVVELGPKTSFLSKPFSPEALARKIRLLIESQPSEPPIPEPTQSSFGSKPL
jgi:PAS domain S-box-containing protein